MKNFFATLGHIVLIGASAYLSYRYPALAPIIAPTLAAGNASLPSLIQTASGIAQPATPTPLTQSEVNQAVKGTNQP